MYIITNPFVSMYVSMYMYMHIHVCVKCFIYNTLAVCIYYIIMKVTCNKYDNKIIINKVYM